MQLSVIIPISSHKYRYSPTDRLRLFSSLKVNTHIEIIVVDYNSEHGQSLIHEQISEENNWQYFQLNNKESVFSASIARNYGVEQAQGDYVLFLDVDLISHENILLDTLQEIQLLQTNRQFIMYPVIYLTKPGNKLVNENSNFYRDILHQALYNNTQCIKKVSYGTSAVCINKKHFHSIGGFDERFRGWGYEDIDFIIRAILTDNTFVMPDDFADGRGNFFKEFLYRGWHSIYGLYGELMSRKGQYFIHLFHDLDTKDYSNYKKQNHALFEANLQDYLNIYNNRNRSSSNKENQSLIGFDSLVYSRFQALNINKNISLIKRKDLVFSFKAVNKLFWRLIRKR